MRPFFLVFTLLACLSFTNAHLWGFFGHKEITKYAIYTLPDQMMIFYKQNMSVIVDKSVTADQRRYVIEAEGPRHYIDLDEYGELDSIPRYWFQAVELYGEDSLNSRGIVPWYANYVFNQLVQAFKENNYDRVLTKSSDLSHYLADANVPLHTTSNYNGQQTDQHGIHGFWETRLPQLFIDDYDFLVGEALYVDNPQQAIWQSVLQANLLVDSVLYYEKHVTQLIGENKKFAYEDKGRTTVRLYSEKFSQEYHAAMPAIELQMARSVKLIGSLWYTAWIEAGQPDLSLLKKRYTSVIDSLKAEKRISPRRLHDN